MQLLFCDYLELCTVSERLSKTGLLENYYQCSITFLFSYCAIIKLWFSKSIIIRNIKIINLPFHCHL